MDPDQPIFQISTIQTEIDHHLSRERLLAVLGAFYGGLAAVLLAIGAYGVIAQTVSSRRKEVAIRLALGAAPGQVGRTIVTDLMLMVLLGIVAGLPFLWMSKRLLTSLVYGLSPTDPTVAVSAIAIVVGVAVIATYGPVTRAVRTDPIVALRDE